MNVKNFFIGGIVGGIVNFLIGWLVWGILLKDMYPTPDGASDNLFFIFIGCLGYGFMLSYVFAHGEGISSCVPGIKMAAGISLFMAISNNFFMNMYKETIDVMPVAIDVIASVVVGCIIGACIAVVNGKMK